MNESRRKFLKATGVSAGLSVIPGTALAEGNKKKDIGGDLYAKTKVIEETKEKVVEEITIWDKAGESTEKTVHRLVTQKAGEGTGSVAYQEVSDTDNGISTQDHKKVVERYEQTTNKFEPCDAFDYTHEISGYSLELNKPADRIGKASLAAVILHFASGGWVVAGEIALAIISVGTSDNEYFFGRQDYDTTVAGHTQTMHKSVVAGDWNPDPHHTVDVPGSTDFPTHPSLGR